VSRTGTNTVRFAVAALLGLAACMVAGWPQSAAGSGQTHVLAPMAAAPTQSTPAPTKTPTATVVPTPTPTATVQQTPAPPPAAPPTHQPTHKPTHKPTHRPTTLHNGSHPSGHHSSNPPSTHAPATHTSAPVTTAAPPPVATTSAAPHSPAPSKTPKASPTTQAAAHATATVSAATQVSDVASPSPGDGGPDANITYMTSASPVQATSAPVWVVPGILLVITSMLALLGAVLGRRHRPAPARVRASSGTPDGTPGADES